jgi:hypothetical protein
MSPHKVSLNYHRTKTFRGGHAYGPVCWILPNGWTEVERVRVKVKMPKLPC